MTVHNVTLLQPIDLKQTTTENESTTLKKIQLQYVELEICRKEDSESAVTRVKALIDSGTHMNHRLEVI